MKQNDEEMALHLNGKKKRIKKQDFVAAMNTSHLDAKQQENIFMKMEKAKSKWLENIDISFMSDDFKNRYKQIVIDRFERINE